MTTTYRRLFGNVGNFNARIEDNVGGIRVVQSFANEEHEKKLFDVDNQNFRQTKLMAYKTMAKSMSVTYMMMRLVTVFVMLCGAWFSSADGSSWASSWRSCCCPTSFSARSKRSMRSSKATRKASRAFGGIWKSWIPSRILRTLRMQWNWVGL